MSVEHLVRMANDIGHFFESEPQREQAVAGIASHLQRFWDPRMRRQILAHLKAGGEGLDEPVREAVARLTVPDEPSGEGNARPRPSARARAATRGRRAAGDQAS